MLEQDGWDDAALLYHPTLTEFLTPLRPTYPKAFWCPADRCNQTIAFWAIASAGNRIVPGPARRPKKNRKAGVYEYADEFVTTLGETTSVAGGDVDLLFPDLDHLERAEEAVEWAERGDGIIRAEANPKVASGWPLRWVFTCPKCGNVYRYTNHQMLILFLQAIYARKDRIRPGRMW
jgi:hypothetical protein